MGGIISLLSLHLLVPTSGTVVMQCDAKYTKDRIKVTTLNSHPCAAFIKFWSSAAPAGMYL